MLKWLLIGAFIGWNLPQPSWAKWIESKVVWAWNGLLGWAYTIKTDKKADK